ncbi:protein wntless-like [Dysidea avara]|uniref:protein wntless-like n=1 Tax=Dysidea avara TaxID=196820 RepID=UPI0033320369
MKLSLMNVCGFVFLLLFLLLVTAGCFFLGAFGPPHTNVRHNDLSPCVIKPRNEPHPPMVDSINCDQLGAKLVEHDQSKLQVVPLKSVTHYVHIPNEKRGARMNRWYQFMTVFIDIQFTSEFVKKVIEKNAAVISLNITVGYKNTNTIKEGSWSILASGHVSRVMNCHYNENDFPSCNHIQLFELGSVHHSFYLINVNFDPFPLEKTIPDHRGLGPVKEINMLEIHHSGGFTIIFLGLKSIMLLVTSVIFIYYQWHMSALNRPANVIEKTLREVVITLIFMNLPLEYLKLWYDLPWMVVLNDFRQGLFLCALAFFWAVFIGEHQNYDNLSESGVAKGIGNHLKQLLVVAIGCLTLFIYEFCERGIQVIFPFYSLWSTREGQKVAWLLVLIALLCVLVYYGVLVVQAVRVVVTLWKREKSVEGLSETARKRYKKVFFIFKCQLVVTLTAAALCVATFLPSELLLHQWQNVNSYQYSFYSGMITGNYGLWNAYVLVTMLLYLPQHEDQDQKSDSTSAGDIDMQQLMAKTALE